MLARKLLFASLADSTFLSGGTLRIFVQADTTLLLNRAQINGMAYWAVNARDQDGLSRLSETRRISYFSSVDETARIPETFHLAQNFPNPFNADTQIPFDIPERGHVSICIYDVQGRMVCHLMDQEINPGQHSIAWHGKDDLGEDLSTGPYFVRIQFKSSYLQNKMLYIR